MISEHFGHSDYCEATKFEITKSPNCCQVGNYQRNKVLYEDGDLSFRLKVGLARFFGYQALLSAQIALKVSEIESMGSCGSILMSRFFSESI